MLINKKYLKNLIIPLVFEQLLAVSVGMADTLMVSSAGQAAISGVALVDNINRLVIQIMAAFGTGGIVVCSQYFGNLDIKRAKKTCAQLELIMLISSLVIMAFFVVCSHSILRSIFGKVEEDVMVAATTYMVITAVSYPFLGIYSAGAAIFRSVGNSKISMYISLVMNILNIIFNAIFIYVFHMGVFGVALSTLISRIFAGAIMKYEISTAKNPLRITDKKAYILKMSYMMRILKIGIPSGIENGMFQIGKLAVVSMVATLGTDAIVANAIAYQIIDFPNIAGVSIGLALVTVVGQCIGAGEKEQAIFYTKKLLKYAYIGDWICKIILFFIAGYLVQVFSISPLASQTTVLVLRCFAIASLPIWPLSFTLPNALRGAGDAKFTMTVSLLTMWICRILLSYVLVIICKMGVLGVWIGMFADWYARGFFYTARFVSRKWLEKKAI